MCIEGDIYRFYIFLYIIYIYVYLIQNLCVIARYTSGCQLQLLYS
jgi:hypothetical protein